LLPATVVPHQSATLCVSAVHADVVSVSGVGDVPAGETTCRVVSPGATTTYVARASNTAWRVTRSITLTVTPDGLP
jgi:hypothetical protein